MKKWALLAFSISCMISFYTIAQEKENIEEDGGIHIGNGVKTVHCIPHTDDESYTLLDFYEAKKKIIFDLGSSNLNHIQKARYALQKIEEVDPERYARLMSYLNSFFDEARFIAGFNLNNTSDVGLTYLPKICTLRQTVVQMPHFGPSNTKRYHYTIDIETWIKLDNINKAGLILHEIIYRDLINGSDHETSYYVREFVRYLSASDEYREFNGVDFNDLKGYIRMLKRLRVKDYSYNGVKINLTYPVAFYQKADPIKIRKAKLITPQSFDVWGNRITTFSKVDHRFFESGHLASLSIMPEYGSCAKSQFWRFARDRVYTFAAVIDGVSYANDGKIVAFHLSPNIFGTRYIKGNKTYHLLPDSSIVFSSKDEMPAQFSVLEGRKMDFQQSRAFLWTGKTFTLGNIEYE